MNMAGVLNMLEAGLPFSADLRRLVVRILRSEVDADDVLQEVHIKAYAWVKDGGEVRDLRPWLMKLARTRATDVLRERGRQRAAENAAGSRQVRAGAALAEFRELVSRVPAEQLAVLGLEVEHGG